MFRVGVKFTFVKMFGMFGVGVKFTFIPTNPGRRVSDVPPEKIEFPAPRFEAWRSIQLSHVPTARKVDRLYAGTDFANDFKSALHALFIANPELIHKRKF